MFLATCSYATLGTEAAAVALWALVTNWGRPKQAVSVAALLAGSVPITSQVRGQCCAHLATVLRLM